MAAVASAFPPRSADLEAALGALAKVYADEPGLLRRLPAMLKNTGVARRHHVLPVAETLAERTLGETSRLYLEHAVPLAAEAAARSLDQAGIRARDVGVVVSTSCTGVPIPSVDADLVDLLGLPRDVVRLPITQLGCAGGAMGLARTAELLAGRGGGHALLVSVELPTLTFQRDDLSLANLVSTCLFGDGAAAAILTSEPGDGLVFKAATSHHFPASRRLMGFDLEATGFHIVLDRTVPERIAAEFPTALRGFLAAHGIDKRDLAFHALHPGGQKILLAIEAELGLGEVGAEHSRAVLRERGNLSSATVLCVLERILAGGVPTGGTGLIAAFGPGFTAELQLWEQAT